MTNSDTWSEYRVCGERVSGDSWAGSWRPLIGVPVSEVAHATRNQTADLVKRNARVWIEARTVTISDRRVEVVK